MRSVQRAARVERGIGQLACDLQSTRASVAEAVRQTFSRGIWAATEVWRTIGRSVPGIRHDRFGNRAVVDELEARDCLATFARSFSHAEPQRRRRRPALLRPYGG